MHNAPDKTRPLTALLRQLRREDFTPSGFGTLHRRACCLSEMTVVVDPTHSPLERQMSKRKPATTSKRARGPKIAARAQRNKQAVVRSKKDNPQRPVAAGSTESPAKLHDDSTREVSVVESPAAALQGSLGEKIRNNPKKGFDFPLATANVQAYQAKLLEIAQANMQFAFEFGPRLATIRSPFEFFALIAEFTSRRIDMLQKHSKEMAAYSFWRINTSR
jgi:hypothetical protein